MGLLFVLPVSADEVDRVEVSEKQITLKSYGLPLIFWGYLLAILSVIFIMFIAIKQPLNKLMATGDPINYWMGFIVYATIFAIPLILLAFFFYEKKLIKRGNLLVIQHCFFWLPILRKTIHLENGESFQVSHFAASPNVAKIQGDPQMRAFQNQGYFELYAKPENEKWRLIDRHSRKADLEKIAKLLSKF